MKINKIRTFIFVSMLISTYNITYASGILLAYVTNLVSQTITTYIVDSAGGLNQIGPQVYVGGTPKQIAIPFYGKFMFVARNNDDNRIYRFNLSKDGLIISALQPEPVPTLFSVDSITIGPHASTVYFFGLNNMATNSLDSYNGTLTPQSHNIGRTITSMSFIYTQMTNYVFATALPHSLSISSQVDGHVLETRVLATGEYPLQTKFSGNFAYVLSRGADGEDNEISVYHMNHGLIEDRGAIDTGLDGEVQMEIADEPFGKLLFTINKRSNMITVYMIDHVTGSLTQIQRFQAPMIGPDNKLTSIAVNPVAKYVYITQNHANRVLIYSINDTGHLIAPRAVSTGYYPSSIVLKMY